MSAEMWRKECPIEKGKAYRGYLAKNKEKEHIAIIVCIMSNHVYWFCISSSKSFYKKMQISDPCALVELSKEERLLYWKEEELEDISYIFCGLNGLCPGDRDAPMKLNDFYRNLEEENIILKPTCPPGLFARIRKAISESETLSPRDIALLI